MYLGRCAGKRTVSCRVVGVDAELGRSDLPRRAAKTSSTRRRKIIYKLQYIIIIFYYTRAAVY